MKKIPILLLLFSFSIFSCQSDDRMKVNPPVSNVKVSSDIYDETSTIIDNKDYYE